MSRDVPISRPLLDDKIALWLSTSRMTDGLWIGSSHGDPEPALQRVEAALELMEDISPLHYRRVKSSLSRIWVKLVPHGTGCYLHSLNACLLDARVVASETTTLEWIASAIIHEATHARLEKRGVRYDEPVRHRIERICARRELDFALRLPSADTLLGEINWRLERCNENAPFTDKKMSEGIDQGYEDMLRHLGTPEWVISPVSKARDLVIWLHRFIRRIAAASV
ncbi:hypothetical protein LPJ38_09885 [Bradyrhizobium daqingense]|uniref:HEXXH motif-containing protein n=1 Tax=Bradyrhizobium daqingense TaxID=993502 RepID=A0A562L4L6_9BRAD|nr:hypothetical protein [Bradyrhizobium daqingense]TWI02545.1 hypothetical protein IQ17_04161 [Bradyrhizobium daqingense]UFS91010.1 hypothetical protein LPJ38_09885 [Bradyrhizobium daqingense]